MSRFPALALAIVMAVLVAGCGCASGDEVRLVSRRGDRYYACDPDAGIGDSRPPSCGAHRGTPGNPRISGPAVSELEALVEDRSTAYIRITFDCDRVIGVRAQ